VYFTDLDKINFVKIHDGGLVLGSNHSSLLPQLPSKIKLATKMVENDLKKNHLVSLLLIRDTLTLAYYSYTI
jgi:hypothetical protein